MKEGECVTDRMRNGQWLQATYKLLQRNEIPVRDLLCLVGERPGKI